MFKNLKKSKLTDLDQMKFFQTRLVQDCYFFSLYCHHMRLPKLLVTNQLLHGPDLAIAILLKNIKALNYFILVQGFRVTCLFTGQYNTKGYDTIIDVT